MVTRIARRLARAVTAGAIACAVAGCGLGVGSAFVGQWHPHDRVAYNACLVDDAGACIDRKQVMTRVPGREFWGALVAFPSMGGASVTHDGVTTARFRLEPSLEVLRGSGRLALGLRTGVMIDADGATALNAMAIGHISMTERLSLHLGAGFVPYAETAEESAMIGARGLVGLQLALSRTQGRTHFVLTVEADTTWIDLATSYRSTGVTGYLGLFL